MYMTALDQRNRDLIYGRVSIIILDLPSLLSPLGLQLPCTLMKDVPSLAGPLGGDARELCFLQCDRSRACVRSCNINGVRGTRERV
jgi:hypothetical protein